LRTRREQNFVNRLHVTKAALTDLRLDGAHAWQKKMALLENDSANHPWNATVHSYCRAELAAAGMVPFRV